MTLHLRIDRRILGLGLILPFFVAWVWPSPSWAEDKATKDPQSTSGFDHSYQAWNEILQNFVVVKGPVSQVKYLELKKGRKVLDDFLLNLSQVSEKEFNSWKKDQQLAFLINAYNGFTIQHILNNYPIASIRKIGGFFTNPWRVEFFDLLGKKRHLDWIEHGTIRKNYQEPRIHFALNCASIGCPALRQEAYRAEELNDQLEEQTQIFLSDTTRNRIDEKAGKVFLSKIFDTEPWFAEDFVKKSGSVAAFVATYLTEDADLQEKIKTGKLEIDFLKYDWDLNEVK